MYRSWIRFCMFVSVLVFQAYSATFALAGGESTSAEMQAAGSTAPSVFRVENFQAAGGKSQVDVAIAAALQWIAQNNKPAELDLGADIYETCTGVQMPASGPYRALTIIGVGKGEFGKATTLKATCALKAVVSFPNLPAGQYWSNVELRHVTVDANHMAESCMDLDTLRVAHIEDISCTGATGSDHWVEIGNTDRSNGKHGTGLQVMVNDLFVYNNATGAAQWAKAQVQPSNGSLGSFQIINGGSYRQSGSVPVVLMGYGGGATPCAHMPSAVTAHLQPIPGSPDKFSTVSSITQSGQASGCAGPIYVQVPDLPAATYGIKVAVTDSSLYDLAVDSVGTTAAIVNFLGGEDVFVHAHAWQTPVLFQSYGADTWISPECDNPIHYCFAFKGKGAVVINPAFYWFERTSTQLAGSGAYFSDTSASDTQISHEFCGINPQDSGGYQRFVSASGPLAIGSPGFNTKFSVLDGRDCTSPEQLSSAISVSSKRVESAVDGALLNNELRNFSALTHDGTSSYAFLLASLPGGTGATDSAVTVKFMGGQGGKPRVYEELLFENGGSGFNYSWKYLGNTSVMNYAGISAYKQPDGSIQIYQFVGPSFGVGSVSVEQAQGRATTIYANPALRQPSGTRVFYSADPKSFPAQQ